VSKWRLGKQKEGGSKWYIIKEPVHRGTFTGYLLLGEVKGREEALLHSLIEKECCGSRRG